MNFATRIDLMLQEPKQPDENTWTFVRELQEPLHQRVDWWRKAPRAGEVSLAGGVTLDWKFPDPSAVLETAYADFSRFLHLGQVSQGGSFRIVTEKVPTRLHEGHRVVVTSNSCRILAGDTEGIRRGLVLIEDLMLRSGGPFLPRGVKARRPVIRTRISRCFFGPINRPPKNRDELADDVNYYPDEYLNRLAHDGVNGLWLTVRFSDLCPSRFFPEFGKDSERRLKKLRWTVQHCARYGIKIYPFCIEPRAFGNIPEYLNPMEYLKRHPDLAGHRVGGTVHFCTSSKTGQAYLEEATHHLFSHVPGLGGLIDINMGERPTHCCSHTVWESEPNNCPRCSKREPWEVFHTMLTAMQRGMQRANSQAELISWLYVPYILDLPGASLQQREQKVREIAEHFPKDVVLQYNFESMGRSKQLGRERIVHDYSLAYVGPSELFGDCAVAAVRSGARVSAKLQVGCSHEAATVPCVPVPGNLYRKYQAMHRLGVSAAMQCWYFGSYPSIMTKAAGELAFAPFPRSEKSFLRDLAGVHWGNQAERVARAWAHFGQGYRQFPSNMSFAWFGPLHDAVAWPLHLAPVDQPIAPSWLLGHPPSGDRIGECFAFAHTLDEVLVLCARMDREWASGVRLLQTLRGQCVGRQDLERDLGLATAMGLQINSALNVLKFYALREEMIFGPVAQQRVRLAAMRRLAQKEIRNSEQLAILAEKDSTLGFHSEAEGYKYFPAKLRWRAELLRQLLARDFPMVSRRISKGQPLFPEYSGLETNGSKVYDCQRVESADRIPWKTIPATPCEAGQASADKTWQTLWQAAHDEHHLYVRVVCQCPPGSLVRCPGDFLAGDHDRVSIIVEPRRLWPTQAFHVGPFGQKYHDIKGSYPDPQWKVSVARGRGVWRVEMTIPFACLGEPDFSGRPRRINIVRMTPKAGPLAWVERHPLPHRNIFGDDNPADYGWVRFDGFTGATNK